MLKKKRPVNLESLEMKKILKQLPVIFPGLRNYQAHASRQDKRRPGGLLIFFLNQLIFAFLAIRLSLNLDTVTSEFMDTVRVGFKTDREFFDNSQSSPGISDRHLENIKESIQSNIFFLKDQPQQYIYLNFETEFNGFESGDIPRVMEKEASPDKFYYDLNALGEKIHFYNIKSRSISQHQNKLAEIFQEHKDFMRAVETTSFVNSMVFYSTRFQCVFYLEFVVVINDILYETNFVKMLKAYEAVLNPKKMIFTILLTVLINLVIVAVKILAYLAKKKRLLAQKDQDQAKVAATLKRCRLMAALESLSLVCIVVLSNLLNNYFYIPISVDNVFKRNFEHIQKMDLLGTILLCALFLNQGVRIFFLFKFNRITTTMLKVFSKSFRYIGFVMFQLFVLIFSFGLFHSIVEDSSVNSITSHILVQLT